MRQGLIILLLIAFLGGPGAIPPALADNSLTPLLARSLGTEAALVALYYIYKNSPAERAKGYPEELGPGEWYVAIDGGLSYLPPAVWKFTPGWPAWIAGRTTKVSYRPGIQGFIKFGRYFDQYPWLGIEVENGFSRNIIHAGQGPLAPLPAASAPGIGAVGGATHLFGGADWFEIWDVQVNFVARHGFLKDKEVPSGRLQPYVGIGPGIEVVYASIDSAKNFAFETQAGLRYMLTDKVALFFEYKFSYQIQVEYQNFIIDKKPPERNFQTATIETLSFNMPHHRFVLGLSYHFKNLFGN